MPQPIAHQPSEGCTDLLLLISSISSSSSPCYFTSLHPHSLSSMQLVVCTRFTSRFYPSKHVPLLPFQACPTSTLPSMSHFYPSKHVPLLPFQACPTSTLPSMSHFYPSKHVTLLPFQACPASTLPNMSLES